VLVAPEELVADVGRQADVAANLYDPERKITPDGR